MESSAIPSVLKRYYTMQGSTRPQPRLNQAFSVICDSVYFYLCIIHRIVVFRYSLIIEHLKTSPI